MDSIEFFTENREYKIRITKTLRHYHMSKYGQYKITMDFIDVMGQTVLSINTTEKEFYHALSEFSAFTVDCGSIQDDIISFDNAGDGTGYFIYLAIAHPNYTGPMEDDDVAGMCFYHSSQQGNVLRLYLESSFYFLEDMAFKMYQVIEDIPYLNEISDSTLLEFLDYEICNFPD